jgi:hypothetical protein
MLLIVRIGVLCIENPLGANHMEYDVQNFKQVRAKF